MAYDLIRGHTTRDWSTGSVPAPTPNPGLEDAASSDPGALAESAVREIARTTNLAVKLARSKRLPPADYEAFKKFHRAWMAYHDRHAGDWAQRDNLNLWNLRQIGRQFDARFKVFDKVAQAPITVDTSSTDLAPTSRVAGHPVAVLLGAGLAIGALAWLGGQKKWRPV
jgi:hypothetical protein